MVAKSFQELEQVGEPYIQSSRMYVKVKTKSGSLRQVRWYTDAEYAKMYKIATPDEPKKKYNQHDALGFQKGYITIFKGDTYAALPWFRESIARYARFWGWYIVSTEEIPETLPECVEPVQLPWESVGFEDGTLKPEDTIREVVEDLTLEESDSEYVGEIKERLDLTLTVTKAITLNGNYGTSTMHIMEDEDGNVFVWTTASKSWAEGSTKHLRGTVKDHRVYKKTKQTILTRCMEVKE